MTFMHIEISQLQGRDSFRPGDLVTGLVHLKLSHDAAQNAKRIEVAFSGRSEISCAVRHSQPGTPDEEVPWHGNGRTVFFDELQTVCVFDQSHLPVLGDSQWPFSFVFPALTSPTQRLSRWGTSINLPTVSSEPDLPLPPSFVKKDNVWLSTGSPGVLGGMTGSVTILYELEARLVTAQGTFIRHSNKPLAFVPYNRLPVTEPSFFRREHSIRCESRRLLPKVDQASFRFRAKSLMLKTPVSAFKIIFEIPTFSVAGEPLALHLGVDYDFENSTATQIPPVYLRTITIGYSDCVRLGLRHPVYATDQVQTIQTRYKTKILIARTFSKDAAPQITERTDLRHCLPLDKLVVHDLSFETSNIKRLFNRLYVTATVSCADIEYPVGTRFGESTYDFIAPATPPEAVQLPDSRLMPPEAQSEDIHEAATTEAPKEIGGESVYELESTFRSAQVGRNPVFNSFSPYQD